MTEKKLGDFKGGGKNIIPDGEYKLKAVDFKVVEGAAGLYAIGDHVVIRNEDPALHGEHCELGFSLSPAAEGIAKAWLIALGCSEEDSVPVDDIDELHAFLKSHCLNACFVAQVKKGRDKTDKYDQNEVERPWENLEAAAPAEGDYEVGGEAATAKREEPDFV